MMLPCRISNRPKATKGASINHVDMKKGDWVDKKSISLYFCEIDKKGRWGVKNFPKKVYVVYG